MPYALNENVVKELRRLQNEGILYPVKTSDNTTLKVVVPKADKSIRMCADFKITLNKFISEKGSRYQTRKIYLSR